MTLKAIRYLVASRTSVACDIVSMAESDTGGFATSGVRRDDDQITFFVPNTRAAGDLGIRIQYVDGHVVHGVPRV